LQFGLLRYIRTPLARARATLYSIAMDIVRSRIARSACLAAALVLSACGGGGGSSSPAAPLPQAQSYTDPTVYTTGAGASLAQPVELTAVTHHSVTVGGAVLPYTATTGHLTALSPTGAPEASFFYVAYTLDGAAPATRPVTFFYNGGPGSASAWLHLGSYGPRRLVTGMPRTDAPTPFPLVDNAETLLDVSDLVFVDAIGSGYSEAIAPNTNHSFWGVDSDAAAFRDFIMRYVAVNQRQTSPRFLFGESYGTTRSAVLADLLESAGAELKGVVLQSAVLDYNSNCALTAHVTLPCTGYMPSYAATAAGFGVAPAATATPLADFVAQSRTLAATRYDPALRTAMSGGAQPDGALLASLASFTGMPAATWQSHFNMVPDFFRYNLLAGQTLGRYDARVTVPGTAPPSGDDDPSSYLITPSFAFRIGNYLATELGYTTPSSYVLLSNAIQTWNFSHDGRALPDTIPDLAAAFAQNPRLKLLVFDGYNDLATPFFTTERDLARLGAAADVQVRSYMGGHMLYLDDQARPLAKADLAAFYRRALGN
jgi:carboxypeptidase C (cathepsin A)